MLQLIMKIWQLGKRVFKFLQIWAHFFSMKKILCIGGNHICLGQILAKTYQWKKHCLLISNECMNAWMCGPKIGMHIYPHMESNFINKAFLSFFLSFCSLKHTHLITWWAVGSLVPETFAWCFMWDLHVSTYITNLQYSLLLYNNLVWTRTLQHLDLALAYHPILLNVKTYQSVPTFSHQPIWNKFE